MNGNLCLPLLFLSLLLERVSVVAAQRSSFATHRDADGSDSLPERNVDTADLDGTVVRVCQPDENGTVGVTKGKSYMLPYAFGMETSKGASIEDILSSVRTSIETLLISTYFPENCFNMPTGRNLQQNDNNVKGFVFDKEVNEVSVACKPVYENVTDCGIYEGLVEVYGSGGDVLRTIKQYVKTVDPQTLDKSLFRLFVEQNSDPQVDAGTLETATDMGKMGSATESGGEDSNTSTGLTAGAIAGIVISTLAWTVGVGGFLYFQSKRRAENVASQAGSQTYLEDGRILYLVDGQNLVSDDGDASIPTIVVQDGRPMLQDGIDEEYWGKIMGRSIT